MNEKEARFPINFAPMPTKYVQSSLKRLLDILFCLGILPIAVPLVVIFGLLVKLTSKGPVFYSQTRTGLNNLPFTICKMRTLLHGTQDPLAGMKKGDNSMVPFGAFLRQSRIDELPQIWNILRGEMSWIGPRPEQTALVAVAQTQNADFSLRHSVRPGITGLAQVTNPNATPDQNLEKLVKDLEYIQTASLEMDLSILFRSAFAVFR